MEKREPVDAGVSQCEGVGELAKHQYWCGFPGILWLVGPPNGGLYVDTAWLYVSVNVGLDEASPGYGSAPFFCNTIHVTLFELCTQKLNRKCFVASDLMSRAK